MNIVGVYKEIQDQHMNIVSKHNFLKLVRDGNPAFKSISSKLLHFPSIASQLKAFYVDLLVPLETNLEKDTKVVQFEQKKFLQLHKVRAESFGKAAANMKKQRKKKPNPQNADKEMRTMQALEEEKNKLDQFCEQSLKNVSRFGDSSPGGEVATTISHPSDRPTPSVLLCSPRP